MTTQSKPSAFASRTLLLLSAVCLHLSCSKSSQHSDNHGAPVGIPKITSVSREQYLKGSSFCQTYSEVTEKEKGIWVTVPIDYSNPSRGSMKIYAYTMREFNPQQPSYIFVDGGPGQNTHGEMPEFLGGEVNEIRFDQRGLGCSAPESYELYLDQSLYSTQNTVRDLEAIREAYKIAKWSVYGVSYGTVPATVYSSAYRDRTVSTVLEGVVGPVQLLHPWSYKIDKLNLFLDKLSPVQRAAVGEIWSARNQETLIFFQSLLASFFRDAGLRRFIKVHMRNVVDETGRVNWEYIRQMRGRGEAQWSRPQHPTAVDEFVMDVIYCKELDYKNKGRDFVSYSEVEKRFVAVAVEGEEYAKTCREAGVTEFNEAPYIPSQYPIYAPTYYFQGSHDGATLAKGALEHWKTVPKRATYFMLAQRGGHNPNLSRMEGGLPELGRAQRVLFSRAVLGQEITPDDIAGVNRVVPPIVIKYPDGSGVEEADSASQEWILYRSLTDAVTIDDQLKGISRVPAWANTSLESHELYKYR